jgi:5-methylcytosine-specific restriction endonuclease McrA
MTVVPIFTEEARCARCGKPLTWGDLTVDHVLAHSRGGRTDIKNAALMHRRCNAAKGAR